MIPPLIAKGLEALSISPIDKIEGLPEFLRSGDYDFARFPQGLSSYFGGIDFEGASAIGAAISYVSDVVTSTDEGDRRQRIASILADGEVASQALEDMFTLFSGLEYSARFRNLRKAQRLLYDRQNVLSTSAVLTDARPVFDKADDGENDDIEGYVVLNTLRLEYYDYNDGGSSPTILYLGLDETDLNILKSSIDRAVKKSETLSANLLSGISKPILLK